MHEQPFWSTCKTICFMVSASSLPSCQDILQPPSPLSPASAFSGCSCTPPHAGSGPAAGRSRYSRTPGNDKIVRFILLKHRMDFKNIHLVSDPKKATFLQPWHFLSCKSWRDAWHSQQMSLRLLFRPRLPASPAFSPRSCCSSTRFASWS